MCYLFSFLISSASKGRNVPMSEITPTAYVAVRLSYLAPISDSLQKPVEGAIRIVVFFI
jgi:hypothetical protein